MRRQKENILMKEEALCLIENTHQLVEGNLDISIDADGFTELGDLARDINQISMAFNSYVNEISHILSHLSAGNMAISFSKEINYQGDFLPIKNALHKIRHSLNSSFEEINLLSGEVDRLCGEVKNSSSELASNASEQAALINDLTSTIVQISGQTASNADKAKMASESVNEILQEAQTGSKLMNQMMTSIHNVEASSKDISQIVTIISELAGRTKLVALNASIEAARAGDMGKGFSVVAKEVGILAEKSAEAVKQTTERINNSIKTAGESTQIADKTSHSFEKIHDSVNSAAGLCAEIAEISGVQADQLNSTSEIIKGISDAVQNNAIHAEDNCTGASELARLSGQLKKVMSRYRLKNGHSNQNDAAAGKIDRSKLEPLLGMLLKVSDEKGIDSMLEGFISGQKDYECMYVISASGFQLSHTIMNPEIVIVQDDNFKPALPGDYHGTKKYFRQAIKEPGTWHTSNEYISTATGGLCRTLSYSYEALGNHYVICIDFICSY